MSTGSDVRSTIGGLRGAAEREGSVNHARPYPHFDRGAAWWACACANPYQRATKILPLFPRFPREPGNDASKN